MTETRNITSRSLAAEHGIYLGALMSLLSAAYIVGLWIDEVRILIFPIVISMFFAMTRMHIVGRRCNVRVLSYTFWLATFACLLAALFTYIVILLIGQDATVHQLFRIVSELPGDPSDVLRTRRALSDPRIFVVSLTLMYWLLATFIISPLAWIFTTFIGGLRQRNQ